jgi:hypothetical protein
VIGGGYVGLEAAASARALGSPVVIVERESHVLARLACETLSIFFQDYHGRHGVTFELNVDVAGFEGVDGQVTGVRFTGGRVGCPRPSPEVPWFWSGQYDLKLQIAGLSFEVDRQVVGGDVAAARFAVFHLKGDLIQAVEAINAPAEFMAGKQLIARRTPINGKKLADRAVSMRAVQSG